MRYRIRYRYEGQTVLTGLMTLANARRIAPTLTEAEIIIDEESE